MNNQIFDQSSNEYDEWLTTHLGNHIHTLELETLFKSITINPGQTFLEIGVGTGNIAKELLNAGAHVTGIDVSKNMLDVAKQKFKHNEIELHHMNADKLLFSDSNFDSTIAFTSLEFMDDLIATIQEMKRVTKKDGQIIVGFLNQGSRWVNMYESEAMKGSVYDYATFYTKDELEKDFSLPITSYQETLFTPPGLLDDCYTTESNTFYQHQNERGGFAVIVFINK
ncbi:class I SAM-dependent methyltransferase [Erysipelothrix urinaevulpis]|uniref:class I SAM-dependent methyltransferase n=1 Tax=Erysipelothrix urinaevulpis TaxID=2683717 RepID=UPI001357DA42|nr:class I SAM-dependent methyltransferase [Erysipelothrix urinaevulpis]